MVAPANRLTARWQSTNTEVAMGAIDQATASLASLAISYLAVRSLSLAGFGSFSLGQGLSIILAGTLRGLGDAAVKMGFPRKLRRLALVSTSLIVLLPPVLTVGGITSSFLLGLTAFNGWIFHEWVRASGLRASKHYMTMLLSHILATSNAIAILAPNFWSEFDETSSVLVSAGLLLLSLLCALTASRSLVNSAARPNAVLNYAVPLGMEFLAAYGIGLLVMGVYGFAGALGAVARVRAAQVVMGPINFLLFGVQSSLGKGGGKQHTPRWPILLGILLLLGVVAGGPRLWSLLIGETGLEAATVIWLVAVARAAQLFSIPAVAGLRRVGRTRRLLHARLLSGCAQMIVALPFLAGVGTDDLLDWGLAGSLVVGSMVYLLKVRRDDVAFRQAI